jgi:hypothetical protein
MIAELSSADLGDVLIDELSILLRDAGEGGVSVGFVTRPSVTKPISTGERCWSRSTRKVGCCRSPSRLTAW